MSAYVFIFIFVLEASIIFTLWLVLQPWPKLTKDPQKANKCY